MSNARELAELSGSYGTGGFVGMKNRIINGAMMIDQRNAGASVTPTAATQYTLDRWAVSLSQASKFSVQQNAGSVTPPAGFKTYLGITSLSSYAVSGNDYFTLYGVTEGFNTADFGWGAAGATTVTFSFWARASIAGNYSFTIRNYGTYNRTYATSYNIAASNTWQYITIVVPGDTTGTWTGATNGGSLLIDWAIGAVGVQTTSTTGWQTGNFNNLSGTTSVVGTSGATFYITGVQLEKGSTATSFDYRPYGTELALCQRYYQLNIANGGYSTTTTNVSCSVAGEVTMRSTPTAVLVNGTNALVDYGVALRNVTALSTITGSSPNGIMVDMTSAATSNLKPHSLIGGVVGLSSEL